MCDFLNSGLKVKLKKLKVKLIKALYIQHFLNKNSINHFYAKKRTCSSIFLFEIYLLTYATPVTSKNVVENTKTNTFQI